MFAYLTFTVSLNTEIISGFSFVNLDTELTSRGVNKRHAPDSIYNVGYE